MSAARDLTKLGNTDVFTVDTAAGKVGVDSTSPTGEFQVGAAITVGSLSGIISATAFYGDGSNLDGVSSAGLGTALSDVDGDVQKLFYYTNNTLGIGSTVNVIVPSGSDVAYTQYADIDVQENCDFIVADGDDFIPDVLGLSTEGVDVISGAGGRIRAGYFTNKAGTGAPQLTFGAEVPVGYGITGAGGINVGGAATVLSLNATGNITAVDATFSGTLTYEDVTNVDATGIITAKSGIEFGTAGGGGTITGAGQAEFVGVVTASDFVGGGSQLTGLPAGFTELDAMLFN